MYKYDCVPPVGLPAVRLCPSSKVAGVAGLIVPAARTAFVPNTKFTLFAVTFVVAESTTKLFHVFSVWPDAETTKELVAGEDASPESVLNVVPEFRKFAVNVGVPPDHVNESF